MLFYWAYSKLLLKYVKKKKKVRCKKYNYTNIKAKTVNLIVSEGRRV